MKLNYKKYGEGESLLILHGLFGSLDNWQTLGKKFAEDYQVILVDQRNHGRSPHSQDFDYEDMAKDIVELCQQENLTHINIIGHSMGGKTTMTLANMYPDLINKMMIVDIAPKKYPPHHDEIINALKSIDLNNISSRSEADEMMEKMISNFGVRQFLLKNLYRKEDKTYDWRFNLEMLSNNIEKIIDVTQLNQEIDTPTLFIRGDKSGYITDNDITNIKNTFISSLFVTIKDAGHWVHAEQPEVFYNTIIQFLNH